MCKGLVDVEAVRELLEHLEVLEHNDPDEYVSDGGHTVLDLWMHGLPAKVAKVKASLGEK